MSQEHQGNVHRRAEDGYEHMHQRQSDAMVQALLAAINGVGDRVAHELRRVHERIDRHEEDDRRAWADLGDKIAGLKESVTKLPADLMMPLMLDVAKLKEAKADDEDVQILKQEVSLLKRTEDDARWIVRTSIGAAIVSIVAAVLAFIRAAMS
jgi:hypothetical protein